VVLIIVIDFIEKVILVKEHMTIMMMIMTILLIR